MRYKAAAQLVQLLERARNVCARAGVISLPPAFVLPPPPAPAPPAAAAVVPQAEAEEVAGASNAGCEDSGAVGEVETEEEQDEEEQDEEEEVEADEDEQQEEEDDADELMTLADLVKLQRAQHEDKQVARQQEQPQAEWQAQQAQQQQQQQHAAQPHQLQRQAERQQQQQQQKTEPQHQAAERKQHEPAAGQRQQSTGGGEAAAGAPTSDGGGGGAYANTQRHSAAAESAALQLVVVPDVPRGQHVQPAGAAPAPLEALAVAVVGEAVKAEVAAALARVPPADPVDAVTRWGLRRLWELREAQEAASHAGDEPTHVLCRNNAALLVGAIAGVVRKLMEPRGMLELYSLDPVACTAAAARTATGASDLIAAMAAGPRM